MDSRICLDVHPKKRCTENSREWIKLITCNALRASFVKPQTNVALGLVYIVKTYAVSLAFSDCKYCCSFLERDVCSLLDTLQHFSVKQ